MQVTEFLHPRAEEIVSMLPAKMGARWAANPRADGAGRPPVQPRTADAHRSPAVVLGAVCYWWDSRAGGGGHCATQEMAHIDAWLKRVTEVGGRDYDLAVEILRCQRLIKGYSDTHARGQSKYSRVMEGIDLIDGRDDAADWARRLREAALLDEDGKALDGALATIRSFV
jgi:indolepyruvate ferredoxin oxidoreductase beta subunit